MINFEENLDKIELLFPETSKKREKLLSLLQSKATDPKAMVLISMNIFPSQRQRILDEGILGVHFEENQRRIYPHNNTASHILGFLSNDGTAVSGIEKQFNEYLGKLDNDKPVKLSIDINIQSIVRGAMAKAMEQHRAKGATGMIMNIKTGEMIAAVSLPDFNPNNLRDYGNNDLYNRFSFGLYELGSVFKVIFAALAAERGISWTKMYDTMTPYKIDKYVINNMSSIRKVPRGNVLDMVKHSYNVGCARVMEEIGGAEPQKELFERLGLTEKLQLEIPERGKPFMPKPWRFINAVTASYGHGIAVSPMHIMSSLSTIVNHGKKVNPTFMLVQDGNNIPSQQVISEKVSKMVRDSMRAAVQDGSGRRSAVEKYDVGGKTGTAIQIDEHGVYDRHKQILSFFAAAPMDDPQYAFYITLHEPYTDAKNNDKMTGGGVVAPIIGEIISLSGPMLGMKIVE
jgi:cell division protein FtsI (penicillin-binding protein 3)